MTRTERIQSNAADALQIEIMIASRLIRTLNAAIDDYSKLFLLARSEGRKAQILDVIDNMRQEVAHLIENKRFALENPAEVVEAYK